MRSAVVCLAVMTLFGAACTGEGNVTDSGKGLPQVSVSFPEETDPGSVETAELRVANPGPGDMEVVVVAFAAVGPGAGQSEIPVAIVGFGAGRKNPSVISVEPEPTGISTEGVVYTFGRLCPGGTGDFPEDCGDASSDDALPRLPEGETFTIRFELLVPQYNGIAANSVQVYDGSDIDRAAGVRMETLVGR